MKSEIVIRKRPSELGAGDYVCFDYDWKSSRHLLLIICIHDMKFHDGAFRFYSINGDGRLCTYVIQPGDYASVLIT